MTFLDPLKNRTFEAERVKNGNEYAWLTPPWVELEPCFWILVEEKYDSRKIN